MNDWRVVGFNDLSSSGKISSFCCVLDGEEICQDLKYSLPVFPFMVDPSSNEGKVSGGSLRLLHLNIDTLLNSRMPITSVHLVVHVLRDIL